MLIKIWDTMKRRPTEIIFSLILIWFGSRKLTSLVHEQIEQNQQSTEVAQSVEIVPQVGCVPRTTQMHDDQVQSGQHELYREFEICLSHLQDAESYYKKVKQELVLGFDGVEGDDSVHMYTVLQLQFLITNTLLWKVIIAYLSCISPAFADWRNNALLTKWRIFQTSLFDVCLIVLPIVGTITNYERAIEIHLFELGMIALMAIHSRSFASKG